MLTRFCLTITAVLAGLFLLSGSHASGQSAFLPVNPTNIGNTPFEHNNNVFTTSQQAEAALESPDPLIRRSGVEWLGLWTNLYRTQGDTRNAKNCAELYGQKQLVPSLTRAVREMPADDRRQAARLLVLVGPAARSAIPTVCIACVTPAYGESEPPIDSYLWGWPNILFSLTNLCGGPRHLAPVLTALMQDREPRTRWAAASATQSFYNLSFNSFLSPSDNYWMTPSDQRYWDQNFRRQMMPVLAARISDNVTRVRLAALTSLNSMTYDSAEAPWQAALPLVSGALNSPEANQRLIAAQILAYVPTDVSAYAASLRTGLRRNNKAERPYVITAIAHAAWSNSAATLNAFLPDLLSANVEQRRSAAADIHSTIAGLWNGNGQPGYEPLLTQQGFQDNIYMARMTGWSLEVDKTVRPAQSAGLLAQRHKAGSAAKTGLLAALVQATNDPDHSVRADAALALEQIGRWTDGGLSSGYWPNPAVEYSPQVEQALALAAASLKTTEPDLAKQLLDLRTRILTPHATA